MLSSSTSLKVKEILKRIASNQAVKLQERVFVQDLADKDQKVNAWFKRARRLQQQRRNDGIDDLLNGLDLGQIDQNSIFKQGEDDLGEWFSGAPSWITRS